MRIKPDTASKPKVKVVRPGVERPAPAKRNQSTSQKPDLAKSKGQRYHGPRNPLVTQFDDAFKALRGHSLRQYANMPKALLDSGVASAAEIRGVLNARAAGPDRRNPDPRIQAEALKLKIAEGAKRETPKPKKKGDGGFLGLTFDVGDAVNTWKDIVAGTGQVDSNITDEQAAERLARYKLAHPGLVQEQGLQPDVIAEAVLGGGVGGLSALGVKALVGQAATRAAGGMLGADAVKSTPAALRYTVPMRGPLKHVVANRPSVLRPVADFAARGAAHRIAAGSAILGLSPASAKLAAAGAEKATHMRAPTIEVDLSELSPDAQAIAQGKTPPKHPGLQAGLVHGPGRLGISPSKRKRLLHQARVNGWRIPDSVNDSELVTKAYKRNLTPEQRLTAGLVQNASTLAFVPAFAGAAYDATQRTGKEGAKPWLQIGQGMGESMADAFMNPLDNPLFAGGMYSGLVRGAGRASAKVLRVKEAPLTFQHGEVKPGVPYTHQYGTAAPNTLTRPAALLGQKLLNTQRAGGVRNAIMAKQAGRQGETITTRGRAVGNIATRDLTKALSKLGKKEQILAVWSHLTGSSAKNQALDYRAKYEAALRRKEGYTNAKGKPIAGRKVDEVNLRALKAKAKEWEQLAHLEANLTPHTKAKIQRFGEEAAKMEAVNQPIMAEFGLTPEGMKQQLWMQALEQHPDLRARVDEAAKNNLVDWKSQDTATRGMWPKKADARSQVKEQLQQEMEAQGVDPKMWVPHTPLDAGPASVLNPGNPFLTEGADRMNGRMKERTGVTLRTGQIDERPSLAISAAAKPSQIKSITDDTELFLQGNAAPLDVTKDRGMRVDGREFVYVKSTKDGKLNRGAIMRRAHDQAVELEKRGLGSQGTIDDLMGLIFDVAEPKQLPNGEFVLGKGTYWAMPRAKYNAWLDNARTEARRRDMAPRLRRVASFTTGKMINTLPRTNVNNLGGVFMSHLGGAGPVAHARYLRSQEMRDIVPPELVGRGISGSQTRIIAGKEGNPLLRPGRWWENRMRTNNVLAEDFARGALAINDLLKQAKQVQHGGPIRAAFHRVNADTVAIAGGLRQTHPERYKKAVQHTIDFVGDMGHLSKYDPAFQIASPFWRWSSLILKATLNTMPRKYPLRATLLQAMGEVGREYQREHGIWPSWLQGAIDLGDDIPILGAVKGEISASLPTGGWWPYATQSQWLTPNFDNAGYDPVGALSNLGPVATLPPVLAGIDVQHLQRFKGEKNQPIPFGSPEWRKLLLSQALQELPSPYSRSGQTTTSLPWDPTYKDTGLPRRGNDPLNLFLRSIGFGTTPVLTGGPDLAAQKKTVFKRATTGFSNLTLEERRAMAKAWRENDDGSFSTIIDLGHGH